jgi:uncharacterized membrane protein HdeD (DUF308 family)
MSEIMGFFFFFKFNFKFLILNFILFYLFIFKIIIWGVFQIFLSTRWTILLNLQAEIFRVNGYPFFFPPSFLKI